MTTVTTVCRNCGVRAVGVVAQCPECGSRDLAQAIRGTPPRGCQCGTCEAGDNMLVVRCAGTAMAMASAGGTL